MRTYETLGSAPYNEPCVRVGSEDYEIRALIEIERYKTQLERQFPNLPEDCYFGRKRFFHGFGSYYSYYEVCLFFDDDNEDHLDAMLHIDANLPSNWS